MEAFFRENFNQTGILLFEREGKRSGKTGLLCFPAFSYLHPEIKYQPYDERENGQGIKRTDRL
jgi:hypothetical protein